MKEQKVEASVNFIKQIIDKDLASGKYQEVVTRFPPEPNGYLHIGHVKAICIDFGIAQDYKGRTHLRFDDTNPTTEDVEYTNSIQEDIKWMGFDWGKHLYFASDYFEQLYLWAEELIKEGKAYVDSLKEEEIREYRGDFNRPGKDSPFKSRSVEENLDLFRRMRAGEFADGTHVLRAKIDMASPNMNLRDPLLYRIRKAHHHRTGDKWCIYPMYDYAHPLSDAMERITHSLCTLEFEDHRPLYDWCIQNVQTGGKPQQIEFSRLNITFTVMSKRKLLQLVKENLVNGWDDPRMPTICGLRRRGYTPSALKTFVNRCGVTKQDSIIDMEVLENCLREDLDTTADRALAVLNPLKVVIENYPEGKEETIEPQIHPKKPELGRRKLFFTKELYIERDDFMENPPADFFRLAPGREVRLRNAYIIKCEKVIKNSNGEVTELRCSIDPDTLGKNPADGRKVKGILHWVSATHSLPLEVRLYERLFTVSNPNEVPEGKDFKMHLNPASLRIIKSARGEMSLKNATVEKRYQFERVGYFCIDNKDSRPDHLVFNLAVSLKEGNR